MVDVFYSKDEKFSEMYFACLKPDFKPNPDDYEFITAFDPDLVTELDQVFRAMNVVDGTELPVKLRCRSMSVGDIVVMGGKAYVCAMAGWKEVEFKP